MKRLLLFLLIPLSGCGFNEVRHVTGRVYADGEPIDAVVVKFWPTEKPNEPRGAAISDENGEFSLGYLHDEGWPAGRYVVTVQDLKQRALQAAAYKQKSTLEIPSRVAERYREPGSSPIELIFSRGTNRVPGVYVTSP